MLETKSEDLFYRAITPTSAAARTALEDANNRLANAAGQGGANFVQNAVLNPLKDKRVATINRIVQVIGGTAAKQQVDALATCTLNR